MPCGGGECVVEAGCIHGCCVGGRKGVRSLLCMEEVTRTVSTKSHRVGADWWTTDSSFVLTLFIFKAPNYVRVEFLLKTVSGYPVLARTLTESEPFFLWQTLLMAPKKFVGQVRAAVDEDQQTVRFKAGNSVQVCSGCLQSEKDLKACTRCKEAENRLPWNGPRSTCVWHLSTSHS